MTIEEELISLREEGAAGPTGARHLAEFHRDLNQRRLVLVLLLRLPARRLPRVCAARASVSGRRTASEVGRRYEGGAFGYEASHRPGT